MAGLPPVFIEFLGKTTGVKTAIKDVQKELGATAAEGETSFSKFGRVGAAAIAGVGLAAGAVALKTIKMAANFQTEMTKLQSAAGLTTKAIHEAGYTTDSLNQKVLTLGSEVGQTGTAMAEALYHPISAGLTLKQSLAVITQAAKEAKISGSSLEDTTYSLSSVMKAFNMPASQAGQAMADLNAIVGQGDMRFQDLNDSIKNWAPTAAQMGMSVSSMGAGLAYLTDRGNDATTASTRLTMGISMMTTPSAKAAAMLTSLGVASDKVHASSKAMQSAMEDAHITQNQLAEDLKKPDGLYVALHHLQSALKGAGVSGTEADSVLSKIFGGGRSDKAIMSLMQNLDGLKTKYNDINKAATKQNFQKDWEKTQKTLNAELSKFKVSLENLGTSIGLKLLPVATKVVGVLAKIGGWFVKHQTVAKTLAVIIGGVLVVALDALLLVLQDIAIAVLADPLSWIVIAIAAVVVAVVLLVTHWKQVWGFIKRITGDVVGWIVDRWHSLAGWAKRIWTNDIAGPIMAAVNAVVGFFKKWWPLLLAIFLPPIALMIGIWNHFHSEIEAVAKKVWGWVIKYLKDSWSGIVKTATAIWKYGIKPAVVDPIVDTYKTLQSVSEKIVSTITGAFKKAYDLVKKPVSRFNDVGHDIVMGIIHGIEGAAGYLYDSLKSLAGDALDSAKSFLGINSPSREFADQVGQWIPAGVAQGVNDNAHVAHSAVSRMAANLAAEDVSIGTQLSSPAIAGPAAFASSSGVIQNEITIKLDSQVLYKGVQRASTQHNRRNLTNGLSLNRG